MFIIGNNETRRYFTGTYNHFLEPQMVNYPHQAKIYNDEGLADQVLKYLNETISQREELSVYFRGMRVIKLRFSVLTSKL